MRKTRKLLSVPIIGVILVLATVAVGLIGCGKSKSKENEAKEPTPAEQQKMMEQMKQTVPQNQ